MGSDEPLCFDGIERDVAELAVEEHDKLVSERGFSPEVPGDELADRVLSPVTYAFCTFFEIAPSDRYADVFEQVADFALHLAKDHVFPDGNKRTSVVMTLSLLYVAGFEMIVSDSEDPEDNELYRWIQDMVTGKMDTGALAEFLRESTRPM